MRPFLVALLVAAPLAGLAAPAAAYCDPEYYPLCANDCTMQPPDIKDPLEWLTRTCPA